MTNKKLTTRELEEYRALVRFIASDYHELSADKAMWQRDDWKRRCVALLEKNRAKDDSARPAPEVHDDF